MNFIAIGLILVGLIIRVIAIKTLGKNFTLTLEKPTEFCTKGIYNRIRHPSYTGSLLIFLGAALLHPALGVFLISWAFFYARAVEEEKLMDCQEYKDYKKQSGMFIPKILRRKHGQ